MEKCQEGKQQMSTTHIYLLGLFVRIRNNICKALVVLMMGKSSIFLSLDTQALLMVPKYLIDRSTLFSLLFSWPWDNHHNWLLWSSLVTVEENKTEEEYVICSSMWSWLVERWGLDPAFKAPSLLLYIMWWLSAGFKAGLPGLKLSPFYCVTPGKFLTSLILRESLCRAVLRIKWINMGTLAIMMFPSSDICS